MKTRADRNQGRRGMSLITVMLVIVTLAAVLATAVGASLQSSFAARRQANRVRALAIAEAGAHQGYSILASNFDLRNSGVLIPMQDFWNTNGRYCVTVAVPSNGTRVATITSTGFVQNVAVAAQLDIRDYGYSSTVTNPPIPGWTNATPQPPGSDWDYALFANGYCDFNGGSRFTGYMHVNQYVSQSGSSTWGYETNGCFIAVCDSNRGFSASGNMTIYGTLWAPKYSSVNCSNIVKAAVPVLPMPNLSSKLTAWYNTAVANGQVLNGSQTIKKDATWTSPGGVKWINGDLTLQGSPTLCYTGALVVTGSININGSSSLQQTANIPGMPAIVARDGSITINGSHNWHGLVYAGGNITGNGSGTTRGTIIAGGNIQLNGSATVNVQYEYCMPTGLLPSDQGGLCGSVTTNYVPVIGASAWQK